MLNLILDIDETLVHSIPAESFNVKLPAKPDFYFTIEGIYYFVYKRPGLDQFLEYAFKNFNISIWTAADKEYAKMIIKNILTKSQIRKLHFFYYRSNCVNNRRGFVKPLNRIFESKEITYIKEKNTIMLDNSPHALQLNLKNTIIAPDYADNNLKTDRFLFALTNEFKKGFPKTSVYRYIAQKNTIIIRSKLLSNDQMTTLVKIANT
jgi:RNA polymerase II subunit A small phosphatase-like protein